MQPYRIVLRSCDRDPDTTAEFARFSNVYLPVNLHGPGTLIVQSFDAFTATGVSDNYIYEVRMRGLNPASSAAQSHAGPRDMLCTFRRHQVRVPITAHTRGIPISDMGQLMSSTPIEIYITRLDGQLVWQITDWVLVLNIIPSDM